MTSNHHGPYALGYTRATMGGTESSHEWFEEKGNENFLKKNFKKACGNRKGFLLLHPLPETRMRK